MTTPLSGTAHSIRSGAYQADIASIGASLRALRHDGRDLVVPFEADEVRPAYRGATLAPWPNRIVDGRYSWAGEEHTLALTEPRRGHALHGLAAWLDFDAVAFAPDAVTLAAVIPAQEGYPFALRIEVEYRLSGDGLRQRVTARNLGTSPAPYGTGPHPYLVAGPGTVDDWTLELPASEVLTVTPDRLSPVDLEHIDRHPEFDFREPRPIATTEIDHAFTGLDRRDGTATVRVLAADGTGVEMVWGEDCPWVQIHTADRVAGHPAHRVGLAVEPMTCPPDAFNTGTDLVVLAPDETHTASWSIRAV